MSDCTSFIVETCNSEHKFAALLENRVRAVVSGYGADHQAYTVGVRDERRDKNRVGCRTSEYVARLTPEQGYVCCQE